MGGALRPASGVEPAPARRRMEGEKTGKIADAWHRLVAFLRDVRVEMTKVTWPTWDELKGQTLVVIIAVLMISAFIGAVDLVLSNTIKFLVTRLT